MSEKKKRCRVQGGWASATSQRLMRQENKESSEFQFQPNKPVQKIPEKIIYRANGTFDISSSANGISSILIEHALFQPDESSWIFEQLLEEVPWKQEYITIKGEKKQQPRLCCWFGDESYSYSGIKLAPYKFSPTILMLKDRIETYCGTTYNSVLVNLYRNEKDSVDWHSDDEESLGKNPEIASLSFGETRMFELREIPKNVAKNGDLDFTYAQHIQVPLADGSLIVMKGAMQADWQHRIPKEYHDRKPRINLTFRSISSS